ncbi:hypothetical protein GCM10011581_29740 [Saccharopolyspora subtropica]|nr:hypothetical protein GCM10011581_29740 [Saccharopolyspora subtropica]
MWCEPLVVFVLLARDLVNSHARRPGRDALLAHLSPALVGELEDALCGAPGAIVVACHDRWLRRSWDTPTLNLHGGRRSS